MPEVAAPTIDARAESTVSPAQPVRASYTAKVVRELLAIFTWLYILTKLFVFDLDAFLLKTYFPAFAWLLDYKFFIFITMGSVILLTCRNKKIFLWSAYIGFYPLILFFWKAPLLILKQGSWTLGLIVLEFCISFFRSFKYNFIISTLFLISIVIVVISTNEVVLAGSAATLLALLLLTYARVFFSIFRPKNLFQIYTKIFSTWRTQVETTGKLDEGIRNLPVAALNEDQLKKWTSSLEGTVLFNRAALFAGKKLRNYQNSFVNFGSSLLITLSLLIGTAVCFGFINLALYKADSTLFAVQKEQSLFIFMYYSFKTLFLSSINELVPVATLSQLTSIIENIFFFLLATILASLVFSVKTQRYSNELNEAISRIEGQGREIERFIQVEYNIGTIENAIAELERAKAGMLQILVYLTTDLE